MQCISILLIIHVSLYISVSERETERERQRERGRESKSEKEGSRVKERKCGGFDFINLTVWCGEGGGGGLL